MASVPNPPKESRRVTFDCDIPITKNSKKNLIDFERVVFQRNKINPLKVDDKSFRIEMIPGFKRFFTNFIDLKQNRYGVIGREASIQDMQDIKSMRVSLSRQVNAAKFFEKFIRRNGQFVIHMLHTEVLQKSLRDAQDVFDRTVLNSLETLAVFGEKGICVVDQIEDTNLKLELSALANEVIQRGLQAIEEYKKDKGTLFLAGLFSVYKNELEVMKGTPRQVRFTNIKPPGTLEMIKSVSGSVKIITDSLIPDYIEQIHKKVVTPLFMGTMGLRSPRNREDKEINIELLKAQHEGMSDEEADYINDCLTSLVENYRSRGYFKSQMQYFANFKILIEALALID